MYRFSAITIGLLALMASLFAGVSTAQTRDIDIPERGLQTELEPRFADADWRVEVGLEPPEDREQLPAFLTWIMANLAWIVASGIALIILVLIIAVLVSQGGSGGFRTGVEAETGQRVVGGPDGGGHVLDAPRLGIEEILRLTDIDAALGALLRLVLETAITLSGSVLKRSATARDILRRLPKDFAHLGAVATLVREAERVRYGGQMITRARFEELVSQVRPLLVQGTVR